MNSLLVPLTMKMLPSLQYCSCLFKKSFIEMIEDNPNPKFNSVRDELNSSADDNEHAPDEPILFIKND